MAKATLFDEFYLHRTCKQIAQAALVKMRGEESPVHPSWKSVNQVLYGAVLVTIAPNGMCHFVAHNSRGTL